MIIPSNVFQAVAAAMSKDTTRYVINGIEVVPKKDGVALAATDGRVLVAAYVSGEHDFKDSFIIPRLLIERAGKIKREFDLSCKDGLISLANFNHGLILSTKPIDGNYPAWRQMLKYKGELESAFIPAFSKEVVDKVFAAQKALGNKKPIIGDLYREYGNEYGTYYMLLEENVFAVLMPARRGPRKFEWPEWAE